MAYGAQVIESRREAEEVFKAKTKKSNSLYQRASQIMPGGVAGNGKYMSPYPLYIESAKGAIVTDVDGNEYVDWIMGVGPLILGHRHPAIVEAVETQLAKEIHCLLPMEVEIEMAEKIVKHVPCAEMVRFLPSGTEACMAAYRVARAFSRRDKIAKVEGGYHGQQDYNLFSCFPLPGRTGPETCPNKTPDCAGIPKEIEKTIEVLPFNNIDAAENLIKKHANELAAVFIEPLIGTGGGVPADKEFLESLRETTEANDVLLVFDEVVTGFRLALGGGQEYFGITPDLCILGKPIGGGFPVGCYAGRKDIMDAVVTPTKSFEANIQAKVFQSGTFSAHPFAMVAGLATLKELEKGKDKIYPHINQLGDRIRKGMDRVASEVGYNVQTIGIGSIFSPLFDCPHPIRNTRDVLLTDFSKRAEYRLRMLARGQLVMDHALLTSYAHTKEHVERYLSDSEEALREMKRRK